MFVEGKLIFAQDLLFIYVASPSPDPLWRLWCRCYYCKINNTQRDSKALHKRTLCMKSSPFPYLLQSTTIPAFSGHSWKRKKSIIILFYSISGWISFTTCNSKEILSWTVFFCNYRNSIHVPALASSPCDLSSTLTRHDEPRMENKCSVADSASGVCSIETESRNGLENDAVRRARKQELMEFLLIFISRQKRSSNMQKKRS